MKKSSELLEEGSGGLYVLNRSSLLMLDAGEQR